MESDQARAPGIVTEVAADCVSESALQIMEIITLGEDGRAQCSGRIAAFGRLFDYEDDLFHQTASCGSALG
jgi:hypothetical protein